MRSSFRVPDVPTVLVSLLLAGPVLAGMAGTVLPAFGYFPVLGLETFSLEPFRALAAMPGLAQSVALSFGTGLGASVLSLWLVLLFMAGWFGTRTFKRVTRLLSPLLSVPHAAAAIGLAFLIAPSGFLVRLLSPWATGWERPPDILILHDPYGIAVMLGLVAKEVPFLFLMTLAALNRPHIREQFKVSASLGYGRTATFFKVILPQVYPLIRLPVLAVISYSTSVVDVAAILGPTTPAPLAPRLVDWMNDPNLNMRLTASAGALLQLAVSVSAIVVFLLLERFVGTFAASRRALGHRQQSDGFQRTTGLVLMYILVAAMLLAMALLCIWTVAGSWWFPAILPQRWSLYRMTGAAVDGLPDLLTTLSLALAAALAATALTLWLLDARNQRRRVSSRRLTGLVFLPLLVPQISFLFGLQMLFLVTDLSGTFLAVLLVHLIFVFPYAFLSLRDPWNRLDPRYDKAAVAMGAPRLKVFWRIRFPLLLRPVLVTFAVATAVSVGQYLSTLMIGAGRIVTITTESVAFASGGNRQIAALYAVLQLIIPLAGFTFAAAVPAFVFRNRGAMRPEQE